jgi:hypothetical protein
MHPEHYTIPFGKYAGLTIKAVYEEDPEFIYFLDRISCGKRLNKMIERFLEEIKTAVTVR